LSKKLVGLVANIQRYSVNDGPGTRTTVFMKGCFLRCKWCHNVEMIGTRNEVWYSSALCTCCGNCIEICSEFAIKGYKDERVLDRNACTAESCFKCVEVCQNHALTPIAKKMTVADVLKEVKKDEIFYWRDGGGVTISGGEPSVQPQFVAELVRECKNHSIHTVLDTCGYASWYVLSRIAKDADLILLDIKHINSAKHEWGTGVSNKLILQNAKKLVNLTKIRIRVPVIPGFNDSEEEVTEIAKFIKSINLEDVDLLPYHSYAEGKYKMYMKDYEFAKVLPPSEEQMLDFKALFEAHGLKVTVGS
jgi:pyruvate formate lyase activating enzyme